LFSICYFYYFLFFTFNACFGQLFFIYEKLGVLPLEF